MLEKWSPSRRLACLDRLREAAALASYRARPDHVRILVGDDAKPAKYVSDEFGLCWIHEGRHYKELSPVVPQHEQQLEAFRTRYEYLHDRISGIRKMPSLASLIRQRSRPPPATPPCPFSTAQPPATIERLALV